MARAMSSPKISGFSIEVPAKWVLSGEHSVLRGASAIAFPYPQLSLKLMFREHDTLSVTANPFHSQIRQLVGRSCEFLKKDARLFSTGEIDIQSQIPIGAGLGSSAALSVAMARLAIWKTGANLDEWIPLATHLEDVFHGKSSGMDVSVIAHSQPILFSMENHAQVLGELKRLPKFELYDSGKRGQTKLCIERVNQWRLANPESSKRLDYQMAQATGEAFLALKGFEHDAKTSEQALARAMQNAQACFEEWGLVSQELLDQKQELLKQGALAVKLTGAGLGGFWIALYSSQ